MATSSILKICWQSRRGAVGVVIVHMLESESVPPEKRLVVDRRVRVRLRHLNVQVYNSDGINKLLRLI